MYLFEENIAAGFPSPAEGLLDKKLDLNELLIKHPAATFFVRVSGDSMIGAGIYSDDILIVDRAETAMSGNIVVALYNGEFLVKRFIREKGENRLCPENIHFSSIIIREEDDFQIWGVVTFVIHKPS
jgi:DNA polymerase V